MGDEQATEEHVPEVIEPDYTCNCDKPPVKMAEWMKGHEDEDLEEGPCRPCTLVPVIGWYKQILENQGHKDKADELAKELETGNPLTVCEVLDKIKDDVEAPLRERLKDFDCAAQNFNEQDALNEDA